MPPSWGQKEKNVVTGRYGTIGEVYYHSGKCWPLNTALFVKDFKGNIPKYVYYLLKNALSVYRVSGNDKSTVPGIDRKVIHEMPVPFHEDISYQQNVCDVLTCIDDKINTNSQICVSLESMAKTLYDYWFVQFDFPDENGRPYRTFGGEMVWNEQLKRKIPKGWEVKGITEVVDVCYGYPFDTNKFIEEDIGNPVILIRDILETTVSARTIEAVDEKYWVHSGDLIVGMDGNFHMNFWNGAPVLLNQRCFKVSHGEDSVMVAYFSSMPYIKAREKT